MIRLSRCPVFLILLVITIFIAGCSVQESGVEPYSVPIKEIPVNVEDFPGKISFNNALSVLQSNITTPDVSIHFIRGENVSADGLASLWIFGVKQERKNYFVSISPGYHNMIPWRAWLPMDNIDVSTIITPERLLQTNYQDIGRTFDIDGLIRIDELELANGIYTLRSEIAGEERVLFFDASSGRRI